MKAQFPINLLNQVVHLIRMGGLVNYLPKKRAKIVCGQIKAKNKYK